jgi:acyl carrier protein
MNTDEKILSIFCRVLHLTEVEVNDNISYNSLKQWDSLTHLELIINIEDEFAIDLETADIIAMDSYGKIKEIVKKYLEKKDD